MTALATVAVNERGQTPKDRLAEGELMLRDKVLGMRASQLCEKYHVSQATLYRRLDDALKARLARTVDQYRDEQNALLDDIMARWEAQANAGDAMVDAGIREENMSLVDRGMTKRAEALNGMVRVSERRAKLNGLDAPAKAEVTVTHTTPVDAAVEALVAEVEAAS